MWADVGFSIIRNFIIGTTPAGSPAVIVGGASSGLPTFADTALGSKILASEHNFSNLRVMDKRIEYEHLIGSGDAIGSIYAEVGMYQPAGSDMFWRDTFIGLTQDGSITIQSTLSVKIS